MMAGFGAIVAIDGEQHRCLAQAVQFQAAIEPVLIAFIFLARFADLRVDMDGQPLAQTRRFDPHESPGL